MKKKRKQNPVKIWLCPRCGQPLVWVGEIALHHCFKCGGWYVADRLKQDV